jgi:hypothetical protein
MPDSEQIQLPIDSVLEKHYRSTALKPAIWMTGVLVWATVIAFLFRVPTWVGIFLCLLTVLSFLLYLGSYIFLMATDREALRGERYSVKRLPSSQRGLQVQIPSELVEDDQNLLARLRHHKSVVARQNRKRDDSIGDPAASLKGILIIARTGSARVVQFRGALSSRLSVLMPTFS